MNRLRPFRPYRTVATPRPAASRRLRLESLEDRSVPAGHFTEYAIPTPNSEPDNFVLGSDGNVWFTEYNVLTATGQGQIGRITPSGQITEFPTPLAHANAITSGPDGNLWFTESAAGFGPVATTVGVMTPSGVVLPQSYSVPVGLGGLVAADGKVWFTEYWDNKVGYIDPSQPPDQAVHEFSVPFGGSEIILGPDGNLWWTSASRGTGGSIGRISLQGVVQPSLSFAGVNIFRGLVEDQHGIVWTGEVDEGRVAGITASGQITQYQTPSSGSGPYSGTIGPDENVWFAEPGVSKIARLTPDGKILEFRTPTFVPNGEANVVVAGAGNTIWVREAGSVNRVAKFDIGQTPVPSIVTRNPAGTATTTFNEGQTVTFDASATVATGGVNYQWDFNSDGVVDATGPTVSNIFENGTFHVTLTVTDDLGRSATTSTDITVNEVQPTLSLSTPFRYPADFNGDFAEDARVLPINAVASISDPGPGDLQSGVTYAWSVTKNGAAYASGPGADAGGGTINGVPFVRNTFSFVPDGPGTYVVTLAFTDKDGSAAASQTLNVTFLPVPPTVRLTDLNFVSGPSNLTPVGNTLYFNADDGVHGSQLWRTGGQAGDAVPVEGGTQGIGPAGYGGNSWAVSGPWLYFLTDNNGTVTLWRNDYSAGPINGVSPSQSEVLTGVGDDSWGGGPWGFTAVGHDLYFGAYSPADANYHLWKVADADAQGAAIPTATRFDYPGFDANGLYDVAGLGSTLYFTADRPGTSDVVVWASDGTPDGSAPVGDGQGGYLSGTLQWSNTVAVGGSLYAILDGTLWRVNGPGAPADRIASVGAAPENMQFGPVPDYNMTRVSDSIYFVTGAGDGSYDVWKCTGTATTVIWHAPPTTFNQFSFPVNYPLQLVSVGSDLYISDATNSDSGNSGTRLWKVDTATGEVTLFRSAGGPGIATYQGLVFAGLTAVGSTLYFWDVDGHLAQTQGTPETTYTTGIAGQPTGIDFLFDHRPATPIAAVGSTLYFALADGGQSELWRTADPFSHEGAQVALDSHPPVDPVTGDPTVTLDGTTQAQADSFLALFDPNAPGYTPLQPPAGATTPIDIVVNFDPSIQINEANLVIPQGIRVQINGGTWYGGSPALTLDAGDLIVTNATFINSTPAPTIVVNGGSLTLRDCTIEESTAYAEPAVQINGGGVDLGTATDPGGNNLNVNGLGSLIENVTTGTVYAFFDHWTLNAIPVPPGQVVDGPVVWGATSTVTVTGGSFSYDGQPHPATGSVIGLGGATVGTPEFDYSYTDDSGNVVATTTPPVDPGNYTVTAWFDGNDDYMPASATATITIYYDVRTLTDLSKAFKAGRTIPIKIELTDAAGNNVSSPDVSVWATGLYRINADGSRTQVDFNDAGGSNPNDLFRYDASLGGYIFNLSTQGLTAGTYAFDWMGQVDLTTHELQLSLV